MRTFVVSVLAFVLGANAFVSAEAFAVFTQSEKLADYRQMVTILEQNYAPLRWKQKTIGLDWEGQVEKYRDLVKKTSSDREFYQVLSKFLASLQDAHVSVGVPSTYQASLGFLCDYVAGKVLIDQVNPKLLPSAIFPFKRGDQLLAIGGVPVEQLLKDVREYSATGYEASNQRLAAAYLTLRRESRGFPVPEGFTTVTVLPKGETSPVTVSATWVTKGRTIIDIPDSMLAISADGVPAFSTSRSSLKDSIASLSITRASLDMQQVSDMNEAGITDIGAKKPMFELPADAQQLPLIPLTAVTFDRNGKKIGLLRLPEYGDENFSMVVAMALQMLESTVDVLVVDQTNNPGGQVSTVSAIMSYFAKGSAKDAMFAVRPSRGWLDKFDKVNQMITDALQQDPNEPSANALAGRFQYLENSMVGALQSRTFLSEPFSLDFTGAMGMINPSSVANFTKPVLLLINELDFSGGDVFPALMKDNGRAVLFGNRTNGAGGNVAEYGPLTNSFFKFHLTESLIVRPNGQYIENQGVEPNINYQVTEKDFNDGYKDYYGAFMCEALKLVNTACAGDLFAAPAPAAAPTVPAGDVASGGAPSVR